MRPPIILFSIEKSRIMLWLKKPTLSDTTRTEMNKPVRILGIAGSPRRESYNRAALRAGINDEIARCSWCRTELPARRCGANGAADYQSPSASYGCEWRRLVCRCHTFVHTSRSNRRVGIGHLQLKVSGLKRALDFCCDSPPAQGTTGLFHLAILYQRFICDPRRKRRRTLL